MLRSLILCLLLLVAAPVAAQPLPALQGDAEAIARIERMFARLGGRPAWAGARSMYIHYRQLSSAARPGEGEERAWRDIASPRERLEWHRTDYDGQRRTWGHGFDDAGGWRREGEALRRYAPDEHAASLAFWQRDFYTMFRRMAAGDPVLRYRFTAPHRIEVTDPAGAALGWWDIDQGGTLLRWGAADSDGGPLSYIYGPYKAYGAIAFPAWGSSSDGLYRFEYLDFAIGPRTLPDAIIRDGMTPVPAGLQLP
jgi:hypothetical protein